jgi:uncharacterized protein
MGRRRNRTDSAAESMTPGGEPSRRWAQARRFWWVAVAVPLTVGMIVFRGAAAEKPTLVSEADIWQLSAEQLEARIDAQIAAGETATLDWRVLQQLDHRTGERSALLNRLDGKVVRLPGFAVPLEDYAEQFAEFLLVPWAGACIHTPPPPPNQMVYALMKGGRSANTAWWQGVWVEGILHVVPTVSPYGAVGFQMEGLTVSVLE